MYRRIALLPKEPMIRLVAASTLLGVGAVAWAFWPQDRTAPVEPPNAPAVAVVAPAARVTESTPAVPAVAARPGGPATASPATPVPPAAMPSPEDDEPEAGPPPAGHDEPGSKTTGETLYLTIVGDQTFVRRGAAGERVDPGTGWSGAQAGSQTLAAALSGTDPLPAVEAAWTGDPTGTGAMPTTGRNTPAPAGSSDRGRLNNGQPGSNDPDAGVPPDNEEPLADSRPWPQPGCPWTLGPEAGQSMADQLRDLYGCRYLSTCQVQTGMCTWHYQGGS